MPDDTADGAPMDYDPQQPTTTRVFLVGLSGSGKSTVGRVLARRLGLPFVDTDAEIERQAGRTIPEIFKVGEPAFRALERTAIQAACQLPAAVIATGGGAPVDPSNRQAMRQAGTVFWLDAPTEVLVGRLLAQPNAEDRPMVRDDPHGALTRMREARQTAYAEAGPRIDTAGLTPDDVADALLAALDISSPFPGPGDNTPFPSPGGNIPSPRRTEERDSPRARIPSPTRAWERVRVRGNPGSPSTDTAMPAVGLSSTLEPLWVRTPSQTYPVYVGPGLLEGVGAILDRHALNTPLRVIADERVAGLHGDTIRAGLGERPQTWYLVPAGEEHKTLEQAASLYDQLLADRVERSDLIVALGGGVIGDLVGFVAATLLRGLRFVQIPTTVLSQVDSSVGGKVGVDHPRGKNMIGAFHQPELVLADVDVLHTVPTREVAAGWAEVVKIAVIQDAALFDTLEASADALQNLEPTATTRAIRRAVELKAHVVEQDERDLTGVRAILNYGHTLGHALEAATDYTSLLHGEGVAIGMRGAAHIAERMGLHPSDAVARQATLLRRLGLPDAYPAEPGAVRAAMGLDKKRSAGRTLWILPSGLGRVQTSREVPDVLVDAAIDLVTGRASP